MFPKLQHFKLCDIGTRRSSEGLGEPALQTEYSVSDGSHVLAKFRLLDPDLFRNWFKLIPVTTNEELLGRLYSSAFWLSDSIVISEAVSGHVIGFVPAEQCNEKESGIEIIVFWEERPETGDLHRLSPRAQVMTPERRISLDAMNELSALWADEIKDSILTNEQARMWHKYEAAERSKIRSETLSALEEFIRSMNLETIDDWSPWVFRLSEDLVDHKSGFPIRQPLFERVIFPALVRGLTNRDPGCARWLAGCSQLIHSHSKQLEGVGGRYELLKTALEHDPEDILAKDMLIELIANGLEYSIHEVPSGVLNNDHNGATMAECSELQDDLEEFVKLTNERRVSANYQKLIDSCSFHFMHYGTYLAERENYVDYPDYLNRLPITIPSK